MNLKRTATIGVVGGALAVWLAAAATSGTRGPAPHPIEPNTSVDVRTEALASEIARLHERLRPSETPRQPGRNLFQFTAAQPRVAAAAPKAALSEPIAPVLPVTPPPPTFKLIGVAE